MFTVHKNRMIKYTIVDEGMNMNVKFTNLSMLLRKDHKAKRGNSKQCAGYTGGFSEIVRDTDNGLFYIHNGKVEGGFLIDPKKGLDGYRETIRAIYRDRLFEGYEVGEETIETEISAIESIFRNSEDVLDRRRPQLAEMSADDWWSQVFDIEKIVKGNE